MNFGAHIFFYALIALLIPVVIHLWSKNTKTKVAFGSLKFLKETETKTTKHLWPSELLLLLVRVLTIGALVIALANPFADKPGEMRTAYLIDPNLKMTEVDKILATLDPVESNVFWLSPEVTAIADPLIILNQDVHTSLKSFDTFDSLVVFSPLLQRDFKSAYEPIQGKINWIEIPTKPEAKELLTVTKGNQSNIIKSQSDADKLAFDHIKTSETGDSVKIKIALKADKQYKALGDRVTAAINSINQLSLISFEITDYREGSLAPDDWLIWLCDESFTPRKKMIYLSKDIYGFSKVSDEIFALSPGMSLNEMFSSNFPLRLESALIQKIEDQFDRLDQRKLPEVYLSEGAKSNQDMKVKKSYANWALVSFLVLLTIERVISHVRVKK